MENQKYWQNKYLFGTEFFDFMADISTYWNTKHIIPKISLNCNNDSHIVKYPQRQGEDLLPNPPDEIADPLDTPIDLRKVHEGEMERIQAA